MDTLIITDQDVKNITPTSQNVSVINIQKAIYSAQKAYVKPILCEDLYVDLINEITPPNIPSAQYIALVEAIKPYLAWITYYDFLPFIWAKTREMGVVNQTATTAVAISQNDLTFLRGEAKKYAENAKADLICFLNENIADYPLYNCGCGGNGCEDCGCGGTATNKLSMPFMYV